MIFLQNVRAHWYKIQASKIKWLHICIPMLGIILFLFYYHGKTVMTSEAKLDFYIQAICCVFPVAIAIVTAMLYEQDAKAGNFQMILSIPMKRVFGHITNLLALLMMGFLGTFLAFTGFGIGFNCLKEGSFSVSYYMLQTLVLFLSNFSTYLFLYIITYTFGMYAGLGMGLVGSLSSALCILPLADGIWNYIPFSYGIRISVGYFYSTLATAGAEEGAFCRNVTGGLKSVVILTGILCFIFLWWAEKWQNKHRIEA